MKAGGDFLWRKLCEFEFDEQGAALSFTRRLARENGWSLGLARRVVEEYRRFIFLALRAGHPVTPSEAVDQAWHLHLVYTRSYWEDLCGGVLGRALHHGPTRGGEAEAAKFEDWYGRTQASYEIWFGSQPPQDLWPGARERFDPGARWQRVNAGAHWLVPKRAVTRAAAGLALAGCSVVLAACTGSMLDFPILMIVGFFALVVFLAIRVARKGGRGKKDGSGCGYYGGGCSSGGSSWNDSSSDSGGSGCGSSGCGGGGCGGGGD